MKQKELSALEQEIMHIVWDRKDCTVRDVMSIVSKNKKRAYTTIATILQRLYDKGLVKKTETSTNIVYSPKLTKQAYTKTITRSVFDKLFRSFGDVAIASFAESIDTLPKEKRKYFLDRLKKHEK